MRKTALSERFLLFRLCCRLFSAARPAGRLQAAAGIGKGEGARGSKFDFFLLYSCQTGVSSL
jgi:hypothetical protein